MLAAAVVAIQAAGLAGCGSSGKGPTETDADLDTGIDTHTGTGTDTAADDAACRTGPAECFVVGIVGPAPSTQEFGWEFDEEGYLSYGYGSDPSDAKSFGDEHYAHFCDSAGLIVRTLVHGYAGDSWMDVNLTYSHDEMGRVDSGTADVGRSPWSVEYEGSSSRVASEDWSYVGTRSFTWSSSGELQRADRSDGWWTEYTTIDGLVESSRTYMADGTFLFEYAYSYEGDCTGIVLLLPFGLPLY